LRDVRCADVYNQDEQLLEATAEEAAFLAMLPTIR
jgi:hypothetical protein